MCLLRQHSFVLSEAWLWWCMGAGLRRNIPSDDVETDSEPDLSGGPPTTATPLRPSHWQGYPAAGGGCEAESARGRCECECGQCGAAASAPEDPFRPIGTNEFEQCQGRTAGTRTSRQCSHRVFYQKSIFHWEDIRSTGFCLHHGRSPAAIQYQFLWRTSRIGAKPPATLSGGRLAV